MSSKISVAQDETITELVILREDDATPIEITISGVQSTLASPTMTFYKQNSGSDVSSTYFTGSMSVSGIDKIVTKTTQNLKAGEWTLSVNATVDGIVMNVATIPILIKRRNQI